MGGPYEEQGLLRERVQSPLEEATKAPIRRGGIPSPLKSRLLGEMSAEASWKVKDWGRLGFLEKVLKPLHSPSLSDL